MCQFDTLAVFVSKRDKKAKRRFGVNPYFTPDRLSWDSGYVFGALLSGALADTFGIKAAIINVGIFFALSAVVIILRMTCKTDSCLPVTEGNLTKLV